MPFFTNLTHGFRKFAHTAGRVIKKAADIAEKKVLPTIEKASKIAGRVASAAMPVLAVAAPELLPLAFGAKALAKGVQKGAATGERLIESGKK